MNPTIKEISELTEKFEKEGLQFKLAINKASGWLSKSMKIKTDHDGRVTLAKKVWQFRRQKKY